MSYSSQIGTKIKSWKGVLSSLKRLNMVGIILTISDASKSLLVV